MRRLKKLGIGKAAFAVAAIIVAILACSPTFDHVNLYPASESSKEPVISYIVDVTEPPQHRATSFVKESAAPAVHESMYLSYSASVENLKSGPELWTRQDSITDPEEAEMAEPLIESRELVEPEPEAVEQNQPEQDEPMRDSRYPAITWKERELIAKLCWLEARGEGSIGMRAVAEVVMNRVLSPEFPATVEAVIYQDDPCVQFTPAYLIVSTVAEQAQYDAVDMALSGPWVLDADYLYFSTTPRTQAGKYKLGNHYFSK